MARKTEEKKFKCGGCHAYFVSNENDVCENCEEKEEQKNQDEDDE